MKNDIIDKDNLIDNLSCDVILSFFNNCLLALWSVREQN